MSSLPPPTEGVKSPPETEQSAETGVAEPEWMTRLGTLADDLWQRGDKATSSALHEVRSLVQDQVRRAQADALREAAVEAEWRFRSMSFRCGEGESSTRLHPVGKWLRERADAISTPPGSGGDA